MTGGHQVKRSLGVGAASRQTKTSTLPVCSANVAYTLAKC